MQLVEDAVTHVSQCQVSQTLCRLEPTYEENNGNTSHAYIVLVKTANGFVKTTTLRVGTRSVINAK